MKINYRILLINFVIVVLVLSGSAIAFYSIMYNVLSSQQSKYLTNSANEFIYAYRALIQDSEDEFILTAKGNPDNLIAGGLSGSKNIDFVFETVSTKSNLILKKAFNSNILKDGDFVSLNYFLEQNRYNIIKKYTYPDGRTFYYGRIITPDFLDNISKKINAEIALVWNGIPAEISNETVNSRLSQVLGTASKELQNKNNFDIYSGNYDSNDILATIYKPGGEYSQDEKLQFLIFTSLSETADLRNSLKYFLLISGVAGVFISLILSILFTDKIRKQIKQLSEATRITRQGNFQSKIEIHSKDELGELAQAFNSMLDELQRNEISKNEYSAFITLLNQNPTLKEVSEASLKKIMSTCGFNLGALYMVEDGKAVLQASSGINAVNKENIDSPYFREVIEKQETIELSSEDKLPIVSAGFISIKIKHLLIIPVIYNSKVISVLELGSFEQPTAEAKEYLTKIKEHLAIGLTNASAIVQLENFVAELKRLNEDYQRQNVKILKQNETLVDLHKILKEKAGELEIQKEKAEEATKLKSQFLASMSHELRTPLNSILGLSELILDDKNLLSKNRERMEVVLKSGRRLMTLINDILDLSKIEAGKMDVHNEEIIIEELLKEVENSVTPLAEKKNLSFKIVRNFNTRAIINTDRNKVTQVLLNLLDNALKFTSFGFVELHVSLVEKSLSFEILDSGIGISEENQKVIFEEFRQLDGTTTRKYGGTGLGLAICKRIAELLNGDITVKSELNNGSIFTFTIPSNLLLVKGIGTERKNSEVPEINSKKNAVLVIDSEPVVRYTIGKYLSSKGYEVEFATDGGEGIEKARKIQPYAITVDVMMKDMTAWEILSKLKEDATSKDIPVILISIEGNKNFGFGLGAYEYLLKPFTASEILSVFRQLESISKKSIEKIVMVDDDESEFEKLKESFREEKIRIDYIKDSELAFSKILEIQPDAVILDLLMPNVDGLSLSYKLKANFETKHIPIIISLAGNYSGEETNFLNNIFGEIAEKNRQHPLDVLKIVRDRIKMRELESLIEGATADIDSDPELELPFTEEVKSYHGNVLIVDDDQDSLYTLSEIVQSCDCKTITARNGIECLRALDYKMPDLILLDIMMPEMDGFQTISRIKQNSKWAHIPVFAITAKAMLEDKKVILKHGFDDYISKPVNSGVLAFKIEHALSKIKIV